MISKELLSKVLDNEVPYQVKVHKIIIKNNSLNYFYNSKDSGGGLFEANEYINIYELAHKCKEWAVNLSPNKHALSSYPRWGDIRNYKKTNGSYYICQHLVSGVQFEAETEPEAIFRACQWILDKDSK